MRRFLTLIFLMVFGQSALAADGSVLRRIAKEETPVSTRLVLEFSGLPSHRVQTSGQRVDLFLTETTVFPSLRNLPEDGTLVKALLAAKGRDLMVSFLMRRPPVQVMNTTAEGPSRVVLELFWGEDASRPAMAFRISGVPVSDREGAFSSSRPASRYSGRWEEFFDRYRSTLKPAFPFELQLPLFPVSPGESKKLGERIGSGQWEEVLEAEVDFPSRRGEALVRLGLPERALELFDALPAGEFEPLAEDRIGILRAHALAVTGRRFEARSLAEERLRNARESFREEYRFLLAQMDLAAGRSTAALSALRELKVAEEPFRNLRDQRLADALSVVGKKKEAVALYSRLAESDQLLPCPFSLAQAAESYMEAGEPGRAKALYRRLAVDLENPLESALARFGEAQASWMEGNKESALLAFRRISEDFPGQEAGWRAGLRLMDYALMSGKEGERLKALVGYGEIASQAPLRELREEAAFKQALAFCIRGDRLRGIEALARFRRDYGGGALKSEAEALLGETLPAAIRDLIAAGEDLQAAVLVEQHRDLLLRGGIDREFLLDLTRAFARLGLPERAGRIYQYLLEGSVGRPEEKEYYLPLLETYLVRGEYAPLEEIAERYLARFPQGADREAIYALRVRALLASGERGRAAELLRRGDRPRTPELERLASELFWSLGSYEEAAACAGYEGAGPEDSLRKAESLYRLGRIREAFSLFQALREDGTFGDQASFRCAQIEMARGNRKEGLNILRRLAETGENPYWRRLAQESLVLPAI